MDLNSRGDGWGPLNLVTLNRFSRQSWVSLEVSRNIIFSSGMLSANSLYDSRMAVCTGFQVPPLPIFILSIMTMKSLRSLLAAMYLSGWLSLDRAVVAERLDMRSNQSLHGLRTRCSSLE